MTTVEAATKIAPHDFVAVPYRVTMGVYVSGITHGFYGRRTLVFSECER